MKSWSKLSDLPWREGGPPADGGLLQWKDLAVIASWGDGWEHASVSRRNRKCPTWDEMCAVKDLLWEPSECVAQYHPPADVYVTSTMGHRGVLHLWKSTSFNYALPPLELVTDPGRCTFRIEELP